MSPSLRHLPGITLVLALCAVTTACETGRDRVLILAAASTIDALESALAEFNAGGGSGVEMSFGPTSVLARQIEEGAPADLMLSASTAWADYVERRVAVARRVALVGNRIEVVVPIDASTPPLSLGEIAASEELRRVAIADPSSVPAGIYAAEALRNVGVWETFEPRLVPTLDVRAALALVADGEADAGFVYHTDALSSPQVRVIARVDPRLHGSIEYPLLLLEGAHSDAARLFEFLASERGRAHFRERGFADAGR